MKKILIINKTGIAFAIVVGLITLLARLTSEMSIDQFLMVEDGPVFINQSILGIQALWEPYAGYLHLYPRIIAWLASGFSLEATPYILLAGSVLAFVWMIIVIMVCALKTELGLWGGLIMVALISLQPNSGEAYLNITNAQWFLGIALSLYLLVDDQENASYLQWVLLVIICLTGPFSLLLWPIFLLKGFIFKELKKKWRVYAVVTVCVIIQLMVVMMSPRIAKIGNNVLNTDVAIWLQVFKVFLFFGGQENKIIILLSLIFWGCAGYLGIRSISRDKNTAIFLILAAGLIFIVGAATRNTDKLLLLTPMGSGARYFVVPYALLFFAIGLLAYPYQYARALLLFTISAIFFLQIKPLNRQPLQFFAFVEFAKHRTDVMIPINSEHAAKDYPGWHVIGSVVESDKVPIKPITIYELPAPSIETNWCPNSKYIGLEINMTQDSDGWISVSWSADKNFSEQNILSRYYPADLVDAHFAFSNTKGPLFFKLDGQAQINSIDIYCLGTK